jgi:Domain of unknown function (DUF4340)
MIRRNTLIVLGLFILLLGGTLIWQRTKGKTTGAEATATSETAPLISYDETSMQSISLQAADNRRVKLVRGEDGNWKLSYPPAEATDAEAVKTAIFQLLSVRISSIPQTVPDLKTVGLDQAAYTILIELKDGKQYLINVGNITPTESGYYVLTPDRTVYIVSKYNLDNFIKLLENPPILLTPTPSQAVPEIPTPPESTSTP